MSAACCLGTPDPLGQSGLSALELAVMELELAEVEVQAELAVMELELPEVEVQALRLPVLQ